MKYYFRLVKKVVHKNTSVFDIFVTMINDRC